MKAKAIFAFIIIIIGFIGIYLAIDLGGILAEMATLPDISELHAVGHNLFPLFPVILIFSVAFILIGLYFLNEAYGSPQMTL